MVLVGFIYARLQEVARNQIECVVIDKKQVENMKSTIFQEAVLLLNER